MDYEEIAKFLLNRKKSGIHIHEGVCEGKRVKYFKGKKDYLFYSIYIILEFFFITFLFFV